MWTLTESARTGAFTAWSPSDGPCPLCGGCGFYGPFTVDASTAPDGGAGNYDFVVRCPVCYDRQAARRRKEAACIGDFHLSDFDWAEYPGAEGIEQKRNLIEKYVEHFADFERKGYGLYIHGGVAGSGKTYLAQCLAGELMEQWNEGSARLCTESDLLEISRRKTEDGGDPLEAVISCRLLILDDYGQKRTGRSWIDDVAFRVIDRRYRAHRVTLLT